MEERVKTFLVNEVRNFLGSLPEQGQVGSLVASVEYLHDVSGGSLIAVNDPTLGRRVFEVKVIQRKNLGWEKPR